MKTKTKQPTPNMEAFRGDLIALWNSHAGMLDASDMLALAAYTVGQIMAMQDARRFTSEAALDLVSKNIEMGNQQAIAEAANWMGRA